MKDGCLLGSPPSPISLLSIISDKAINPASQMLLAACFFVNKVLLEASQTHSFTFICFHATMN